MMRLMNPNRLVSIIALLKESYRPSCVLFVIILHDIRFVFLGRLVTT